MSSSQVVLPGRRAVLRSILGASLMPIFGTPGLCAADAQETTAGGAQRSTVIFADRRTSTSWMAFEMPDDRRIVIPGRINGVAAHIILDSGVGAVILNKNFASALSLKATGNTTGIGVTGLAQGQVLEGVSISLDDSLTIHTRASALFDLAPLEGALNEPISALLGGDLFEALIVDIDFPSRRIAFRNPNVDSPLPGGFRLSVQRDRFGLRSLPISVDDGPPIQATLDLGSDRALRISPTLASTRGILADKKVSTTLSAGVSGNQEGKVAVLPDLAVGRAIFHKVPFEVPGAWTFAHQAIVGIPVVRRTRIVMDFPRDQVDVLPDATLMLRPFRKDRSGLGARRMPDRLKVMHVAVGSPAEAAGLHVGDEIIAINDQPLNAEYFRTHPRDGSQPAGTVMYLTLAEHQRLKVTLADYF